MDGMLNNQDMGMVEKMAINLADMAYDDEALQVEEEISCKLLFSKSLLVNNQDMGMVEKMAINLADMAYDDEALQVEEEISCKLLFSKSLLTLVKGCLIAGKLKKQIHELDEKLTVFKGALFRTATEQKEQTRYFSKKIHELDEKLTVIESSPESASSRGAHDEMSCLDDQKYYDL
ncbi:hypothetical protein QYE76_000318 [Lolium multiflorum]|uniref:Uncharacterized protein n=1 Tax=Lolium multiflorum TaxID=4521 RepID=A0AAD8RIX3_LOLMU|nr:hypothetical protein QYE76_000318 [Lolium multiflorum]